MLSVLETKAKMKGKPVIVSLEMDKPTIMSEFEGSADAILVNFGVQNQAVLDIISGKAEPSALLPLQMPADMRGGAIRGCSPGYEMLYGQRGPSV
jgi:beta-glucosidase